MRRRVHALLLIALPAALLLLAACGGDDSKAEKKGTNNESSSAATAAAATQSAGGSSGSAAGGVGGSGSSSSSGSTTTIAKPLPLDCAKEIKALKFDGKIAIQQPQSGSTSSGDIGSLLDGLFDNVTFSGAAVSPDRAQMTLKVGGQNSAFAGQAIEFIQIGDTSYFKLGATGWQEQKNTDGSPAEALDPREICTSVKNNLSADVPTKKEKVNGVDATRYDYDRKALEKVGGDFLGGLTSDTTLPENTKMSVWVSDKDKFPVKISVTGSGQQAGQQVGINFEMNVTDLNSSNIKIEAPR